MDALCLTSVPQIFPLKDDYLTLGEYAHKCFHLYSQLTHTLKKKKKKKKHLKGFKISQSVS